MPVPASDSLHLVGHTPLVHLRPLPGQQATLLAKVESANPGGSVKDRIALAMVEAAERDGTLPPGGLLIEPTSGNTGIGLALVAAVKGYRLMLTMPDSMSVERRKLLAAYGAQLVLTEGAQGMRGAIERAQALLAEHPGAFMPRQFDNPANPECHRLHTAREILDDTDGRVDAFIAGVGTGGTITGTGSGLKAVCPTLRVIAVEPAESPVLSGGAPGKHGIQGIGAGFVPSILDRSVIDEIVTVTTDEALHAARDLARRDGVLAGISSGAALHAARAWAARPENEGKRGVVLLPDGGDRYLSTALFA